MRGLRPADTRAEEQEQPGEAAPGRDAGLDAAAVAIQSGMRGMRDRRRVRGLRPAGRQSEEDEAHHEGAAVPADESRCLDASLDFDKLVTVLLQVIEIPNLLLTALHRYIHIHIVPYVFIWNVSGSIERVVFILIQRDALVFCVVSCL